MIAMENRNSYPGIRFCLAVLLALTSVTLTAPGRAESPPLYFVQITDTHMGVLDHNARTRAAVKAINRLKFPVQCVVHTGDITEEKILDANATAEAAQILDKLKAPVHYLSGNNDIRPKKLAATRAAYERLYGSLISQARYGEVIFLFVYTEPLAEGFTLEGYDVLSEVEARLKAAGETPVLLFHHTPSTGRLKKGKFRRGWPRATREQWQNLLNRYSVKAVFAGHFHQDELHWLGDIPVFAAPPVSGRFGRQAAFRVYTYHQGRVAYSTQYVSPAH